MARDIEIIRRDVQITTLLRDNAMLKIALAEQTIERENAQMEGAETLRRRFTAELDAATKEAVAPPKPIVNAEPMRVDPPADAT